MATVSGVWVFPEVIELPDVQIEQVVNFTNTNANGEVFSRSAFRTVPSTVTSKNLSYQSKIGENFWAAYYANSYYIGDKYYDVAGWKHDYYRTVDFGSTPQEVSEEFYEWFTANATQGGGEEEGGATVAYNGSDLLSLEAGQTGTLNCAGNKMAGDVVVSFEGTGSVTYNGTTTEVEAGKTATLPCAGKKMLSDVVVAMGG